MDGKDCSKLKQENLVLTHLYWYDTQSKEDNNDTKSKKLGEKESQSEKDKINKDWGNWQNLSKIIE